MIRIVIADDHPVFREGLRRALTTAPDVRLVGEASDGEEALALCESTRPDVLVLDLTMPRGSGFDVLRDLPRVSRATRVVVLTVHLERGHEQRALEAGARGFLQKDSSVETILKAVRAVAAGRFWASRAGASQVLISSPAEDLLGSLTAREREVLGFLGRGMMNREIGEKTRLSEGTVASHVASVISKLGLRGRVDAALFAKRTAEWLSASRKEGAE